MIDMADCSLVPRPSFSHVRERGSGHIEVDHSNDCIYIWIVKLTTQMKLLLP